MENYNYINEVIVDSFAGGGGASTGIELALGRVVDVAINHDIKAIQMHQQNHPQTKHYCENVFAVDPKEATQGKPVGLFWLSPDCTHFSKAKGAKPVKKEIRALAWLALKWASAVKPRVIILENVEEFQTWGPIKTGKPIKERQGETFNQFVWHLRNIGYEVQWRTLKACDYGAPTSRKRFFLIARSDGEKIVWPEATHGINKIPYRTAAEVVDFTLPCKTIFNRTKPLVHNTMRRIAAGVHKFILTNAKPFIFSIGQTGTGSNRLKDVDEPLNTIVTKAEQCFVRPQLAACFLSKRYTQRSDSDAQASSLEKPVPTITTADHNQLVMCYFVKYYGTCTVESMEEPLHTITSTAKFSKCKVILCKYEGGSVGNWVEIRSMLNEYCGYNLLNDQILVLQIDGSNYFISDIQMRMLTPRELFNAQGFPPDYKITFDVNGKSYSISEQINRCGNSVSPQVVKALVSANLPELAAKEQLQTMEQVFSAIAKRQVAV